jgi:hypothetical protein
MCTEIPIDWGVLIPGSTLKSPETKKEAEANPASGTEEQASNPASVGAVDMRSEDRPTGDASTPLAAPVSHTRAPINPNQEATPDVVEKTLTVS